jgi:glycosyltransferase involved in cell wall biosynthesis
VADRSARTAPRIVYVVDEFPSVSETFILREMQGLRERHGLRILPAVLRRGREPEAYSEAARALVEEAVFRPGGLGLSAGLIGLALLLRRPGGWVCAVRMAGGQALRRPRLAREIVGALFTAGYFALRLPSGIRHVHAHFASQPATVGLFLAEILGVGYSFSAHAHDIFTDAAHLMEVKLPEAEFVAVCTAYGLETLARKHPLTSAGKLQLVYHGLDVDRYRPTPHPPAPLPSQGRGESPSPGWERQVPVILSVGRLVEKKGFPFLLRAAGILRSRGAEFRLVIIGEGPERADLMSLATGLNLQDLVEWRGAQSAEQVREAYAEADVFALACVIASDGDRDGLPNVLLEALACGVPVVATKVGALPELIEPEQTGLLAKPGDPQDLADQLERMLYDEELRATVTQLGRERVERRFRLERSVAHMADLLEAAL